MAVAVRKKTIRLIFILLLLCESIGGQSKNKYELKQILSLGVQKNNYFLSVSNVSQSNDGDLFVTDQQAYSVKKFNKNGSLVKKIGKKGKKNGEFSAPDLVVCSNNLIAIADYNSTKVQIFDTDLNFIKKFYVDGIIFDMGIDSKEKVWVMVSNFNLEMALKKYDLNGKLLKTIIPKNSSKKEFMIDAKKFCISKNGHIFIVNLLINKIEKWNTDGKYINEFSIKDVAKSAKKKIYKSYIFYNEYLPDGNLLWDIECDRNERIYILSGNYSKHKYQDVYVLSPDGKFLSTLILPFRCHNFRINQTNDNLFLINKNRTEITQYSLIFHE